MTRIKKKKVYLFFRTGHFYPLELCDDAEAAKNAECNPGTTKVETVSGRRVWTATTTH
ncbi:hypothetical protein [Methylobacterium gnaphalii]|uniref:hypothetical protein n=1 Tax=Methylobacterium gnaphalii TaxID=1010610 RepID=UPI001478197C|nr:hypothetical protein [Methylobacterium gnaphalii]GJD69452.1 hypothetical protein MMMDOFMJ_2383 [Methylobacterium gnaphalii]